MISLVNGFICRSPRDVQDALQGKQPPAKPGELPYSASGKGKILSFVHQPAAAVPVGGAIDAKAVAPATSADTSLQTSGDNAHAAVNRIA